MVANSVRRDDGKAAVFWQFTYADRLKQLGTLAPIRTITMDLCI